MSAQWKISEMEDALQKLPNPPAKSRYVFDTHGIPHITMTIKVRGDQYVKCKINGIDITNTVSRLFDQLFELELPIHEYQKRLDEVIQDFATIEKRKRQATFLEVDTLNKKNEIIKKAFNESNVKVLSLIRYLPERDTENYYADWWTQTALKITQCSDITIGADDVLLYVREALQCTSPTA